MDCSNGNGKRRTFHWSDEARQLVADQRRRIEKIGNYRGSDKAQILSKLIQVSGNPRDACLRFLRRLGVAEKRSYREWTTRERQRLVELMDDVPVEEAARVLRRPPASVRSMLHRLGLGVRQSREWFTVSLLAQALHIGRDEVRKWVDRGWLQCRVVQAQRVKVQIIDADDFCAFVKNYGREVIGHRLSYEGLAFVRDYVFPRSHADLFSVRGPYNKASKVTAAKPVMSDPGGFEENVAEQSA
ncbi:MAG: hypothetical protein LAP86_12700 [Acidobacteriia bacterium]|nr:hypothetical protein [Terriglobia bacterium]